MRVLKLEESVSECRPADVTRLLPSAPPVPRDQGGPLDFDRIHDEGVKKSLIAAALLSAATLRASATPADELTTPMANGTSSLECLTGPDMLCDSPRREAPLDRNARRPASKADIEFEKWAVLLLQVCAAGRVLLRSGREPKSRPSALRSTSPLSEPDGPRSVFEGSKAAQWPPP
jgi:hypothetical protein